MYTSIHYLYHRVLYCIIITQLVSSRFSRRAPLWLLLASSQLALGGWRQSGGTRSLAVCTLCLKGAEDTTEKYCKKLQPMAHPHDGTSRRIPDPTTPKMPVLFSLPDPSRSAEAAGSFSTPTGMAPRPGLRILQGDQALLREERAEAGAVEAVHVLHDPPEVRAHADAHLEGGGGAAKRDSNKNGAFVFRTGPVASGIWNEKTHYAR